MATVIFRIKGIKESPGIKVRFKQGNLFDYELSTGFKVNRKHWSNKQQRVKNLIEAPYKDNLNKKLNELNLFLMNAYYDSCASGIKITQLWLREKVSECLNKPTSKEEESNIYFIPFIDKYIIESKKIKNKKTGKPLAEGTLNKYDTTILKLRNFETKFGLKLKIVDINLNFHSKFKQYLSEDLLLNPNTIGGYFSTIKLFCNNAEIKGIEVSKEIKSKNFYSPQNTTNDIYLNTNEIDLIFNHTFDSERLENARDWLIIGLWTGLRVSDLLNLNIDNIIGGYIHKLTSKTETSVIIPIHPQVKYILEKDNNNFPRIISEQKFNKYIKEVCEKVGLTQLVQGSKIVEIKEDKIVIKKDDEKIFRKKDGLYPKYELVSTHVCRRSFATNLYGNIDTMTIMKITGHATEKQFLEYIKTTPKEYAEKLKKLWDK
jgi:integrase